MEYIIAVFWSRTEAFAYANNLKKIGVPAAIIQTPKEAGRTCGLSVKFLEEYFNDAKELFKRSMTSSFGGWYASVFRNGRNVIIKI